MLVQEGFGSTILASTEGGATVHYDPQTDVFKDDTGGDMEAFKRGRAAITLYLYLGPSGLEHVYGAGGGG